MFQGRDYAVFAFFLRRMVVTIQAIRPAAATPSTMNMAIYQRGML